MQNIADKTFGSAEINHKSISDDGNKNKCPHEIGILNDKVQSLEMFSGKRNSWRDKFIKYDYNITLL